MLHRASRNDRKRVFRQNLDPCGGLVVAGTEEGEAILVVPLHPRGGTLDLTFQFDNPLTGQARGQTSLVGNRYPQKFHPVPPTSADNAQSKCLSFFSLSNQNGLVVCGCWCWKLFLVFYVEDATLEIVWWASQG